MQANLELGKGNSFLKLYCQSILTTLQNAFYSGREVFTYLVRNNHLHIYNFGIQLWSHEPLFYFVNGYFPQHQHFKDILQSKRET